MLFFLKESYQRFHVTRVRRRRRRRTIAIFIKPNISRRCRSHAWWAAETRWSCCPSESLRFFPDCGSLLEKESKAPSGHFIVSGLVSCFHCFKWRQLRGLRTCLCAAWPWRGDVHVLFLCMAWADVLANVQEGSNSAKRTTFNCHLAALCWTVQRLVARTRTFVVTGCGVSPVCLSNERKGRDSHANETWLNQNGVVVDRCHARATSSNIWQSSSFSHSLSLSLSLSLFLWALNLKMNMYRASIDFEVQVSFEWVAFVRLIFFKCLKTERFRFISETSGLTCLDP